MADDDEIESSKQGPIKPPPDWKIERVLTALSETIDWSHGFFGLDAQFYEVDCSNLSLAVLDTGIDRTHPDLKFSEALDFTGSANGPDDMIDHGTWCCGYVAALPNEVGVRGITASPTKNSTVRLHSYKVLGDNGSGYHKWIYGGLEAAIENHIDIISCSWGGGPADTKMQKLFKHYIAQGGFPFAAAGNSGNARDEDYPAKYEAVPGVAAVGKNGKLTNFSSYGPGVVGCAPGYQMLSTIAGGYGLMSGTSMACPCFAGVWAKILAAILNSGRPRPPIRDAIKFIQNFAKIVNNIRIIDPPTLLKEVAKMPAPPVAEPPPMTPDPPAPIEGGRWVWIPGLKIG